MSKSCLSPRACAGIAVVMSMFLPHVVHAASVTPATLEVCTTRDGFAQTGVSVEVVTVPYSLIKEVSDEDGCFSVSVATNAWAFYFNTLEAPVLPQKSSTVMVCAMLDGEPVDDLPVALVYTLDAVAEVASIRTDDTGCGTSLAFTGPYDLVGTYLPPISDNELVARESKKKAKKKA